MNPTTETVYQQTEVVYRPTTEDHHSHHHHHQSESKLKLKNPFKMPQALLSPDRSVRFENFLKKI